MPKRIPDPDVRLLAGIASTLREDYIDESNDWEGSPFAWIKIRPSRQVGKIGEQLVAGWCAAKDLDVTSSGSSDFDRYIHGYRCEIKFSTLWKNGTYVFQQVRDQPYDLAICLGLSPFDASCWVLSKDVLRQHVIGHTSQHGGRAGTDTAWFRVSPDSPPEWIAPYGGRLRIAYRVLNDMGVGLYISRHS